MSSRFLCVIVDQGCRLGPRKLSGDRHLELINHNLKLLIVHTFKVCKSKNK